MGKVTEGVSKREKKQNNTNKALSCTPRKKTISGREVLSSLYNKRGQNILMEATGILARKPE